MLKLHEHAVISLQNIITCRKALEGKHKSKHKQFRTRPP